MRAATARKPSTLYELLQDHVIPTYYQRGDMGYSPEWIQLAKHSIATLLPRFSSTRMVSEYLAKFYLPASAPGPALLTESSFEAGSKLAAWKAAACARAGTSVRLRRLDTHRRNLMLRRRSALRGRRLL